MKRPKRPSVDLKRRPPKSLPGRLRARFTRAKSGPQGPRRPRFSFFRFTCQTAGTPAHSTRRREHGHEHGRMLGHRVDSEGLRGRAIAPRRRRTQEDLYRVRLRFLSTVAATKTRKKAPIFAGFCPDLWHHACSCFGPLPCPAPLLALMAAPWPAPHLLGFHPASR